MDKEFNLDTMTDEYVDVLRELGNIGAVTVRVVNGSARVEEYVTN